MEPDEDLDATQVELYPDEVNNPQAISALCAPALQHRLAKTEDD